jgi:selenide,water dikinase
MTISIKMRPWSTLRNWDSYGHKLNIEMKEKQDICDPQTSGGLLIAVKKRLPKNGINSKKVRALC